MIFAYQDYKLNIGAFMQVSGNYQGYGTFFAQQEAVQKTTQPKPGNNSAAIMNSVSQNLNMINNASVCSGKPESKLEIFVPRSPEEIGVIKPVIESKNSMTAQQIEGSPEPAQIETLSDKILSALSENEITLSPSEKFNISVDKYCNVTVTGDDAEKAKAIEKVLNSPGSENWGLLLQRENLFKDLVASDGMTKEQADRLHKMLLENYLTNASGGKVSLNNLYLLDNGKIMGLPPELEEIINSVEPAYFGMTRQELEKQFGDAYDSVKESGAYMHAFNKTENVQSAFNAGDKEKAVKLAVDSLIQDNRFVDIKSTLTEVLRRGVNNIPDMNANFVLGNGDIAFV
jgi:hypothetical protein